jgi:hypothetical protein
MDWVLHSAVVDFWTNPFIATEENDFANSPHLPEGRVQRRLGHHRDGPERLLSDVCR